MARKEPILKFTRTGLFVLTLFVSAPSLLAENRLSFVVRSAEIVDVYLTNSDQVAAMQLFIHMDGPGSITGADLIDRTNSSDWSLPFSIIGTRDIRILLLPSNLVVLQAGSGSVIRLHLGKDPGPGSDSTSLSFETAILASSSARALDVEVQSVTFRDPSDLHSVVRLDNYPNPFNPSTSISFELDRPSNVELSVYDIQGRRISVLINERLDAGRYDKRWDGAGERGIPLPSGLYICRILVDGVSSARKMMLTK